MRVRADVSKKENRQRGDKEKRGEKFEEVKAKS